MGAAALTCGAAKIVLPGSEPCGPGFDEEGGEVLYAVDVRSRAARKFHAQPVASFRDTLASMPGGGEAER